MKTEALRYLGERKSELRSAQLPEPEAHEVLVEMEVAASAAGGSSTSRPR